MCVEQAEVMREAFPQARFLFMYRDAESVVQSGMGAFCRFGSELWWMHHLSRWTALRPLLRSQLARHLETVRRWFPCIDLFDVREWSRMGAVGMLTVTWLSAMHRYRELHAAGFEWTALRYEDLIENPEQVLEQLFGVCGLPTGGRSRLPRRVARRLPAWVVGGAYGRQRLAPARPGPPNDSRRAEAAPGGLHARLRLARNVGCRRSIVAVDIYVVQTDTIDIFVDFTPKARMLVSADGDGRPVKQDTRPSTTCRHLLTGHQPGDREWRGPHGDASGWGFRS